MFRKIMITATAAAALALGGFAMIASDAEAVVGQAAPVAAVVHAQAAEAEAAEVAAQAAAAAAQAQAEADAAAAAQAEADRVAAEAAAAESARVAAEVVAAEAAQAQAAADAQAAAEAAQAAAEADAVAAAEAEADRPMTSGETQAEWLESQGMINSDGSLTGVTLDDGDGELAARCGNDGCQEGEY